MGPHPGRLRVDGRQVRPVGFQGERRGNVEGVEQVGHVGEHQRAVAHRHPVGAYQGEALFRFQAHGLQPGGPQGVGAREPASLEVGLPATDQDLPDLRHLGQVGLPDRTAGADHGMDPGVQGVEKGLDELGPHPHAALGHAVRPRGHHRAHHAGAQLVALVGGVAGNQAHGELLQVLEGYAVAGKRAHPRVHTVDQVTALEDPVHHVPRPPHVVEGLAGDPHAGTATGDADHLLDGEVVAGERHRPCGGMRERHGSLRLAAHILTPHAGLLEDPMPD
jgi:hypothetical protein